MTTPGLRERKKQATRAALREAALRLALEHGPDGVRVEDIAEAAGVSPRTYNNYFASREQAIAAAVAADRESRIAAAVTARPAGTPLAEAVTDAVVEKYADTAAQDPRALLLVVSRPALREAFLDTTAGIEPPLADAIAERLDGAEPLTARVLAAATAAAVRVALGEWLRPAAGPAGGTGALVVPAGPLPDRLRAALAPLAPAFAAAERPVHQPVHPPAGQSGAEPVRPVRRVVPNVKLVREAARRESREFYGRLGLEAAMDHGWIMTLAAPGNPTAQLGLATGDATAPVVPDLSVEVDDVDAAYAAMRAAGAEIVHPLCDEELGVRRFFVRDPNGRVVNVLGHR
ncbi:putative TetR family transcriptional regulator [Kitasatospora setae KM-6054]|uniref:Putative TetR family transcriptional regulator n=1 Tax=Kitasatospora setae (strain ATCC 33774 / DSM 43861 / JCM 3304 / KCC A-0304 / NBRC 14216 / KM-6054) TaxID=452652 RepID=E4N4P8_KITSK|nr:putative TetR family transcriptional regulator [Kitasatospora setae KM-6054]